MILSKSDKHPGKPDTMIMSTYLINKQKSLRRFMMIIIFILILVAYCYIENNWIEVEHFQIKINHLADELNRLKIVQISDTHLPKNASDVESLLEKIKAQNADLIVMTGDTINENADLKTCDFEELCGGLTAIAPTYAVSGNHESANKNIKEWINILRKNNIEFINNKSVIFTKNCKSIRIIGLADGNEYQEKINKDETQIPIILLAHRPELFVSSYSADCNTVRPDLVLAGHAHGGQFRIPLIEQGLFAPNQGFFPKYTSGLYINNQVQMIVSRGLGKSIFPFRINNRPHLPVIELIKAE